MNTKIVNVSKNTFEKIAELSKFYDITRIKLLEKYIDFLYENKENISKDFFNNDDEKGKKDFDILKPIDKKITKEINRIIGFLRIQDKYMEVKFAELKREILYNIKDNTEDEFHPFFIDYDFIISVYNAVLEKNLITEEKLHQEIKQLYNEQDLNIFKESLKKVSSKKFIE